MNREEMIEKLKKNDRGFYALNDKEQQLLISLRSKDPNNLCIRGDYGFTSLPSSGIPELNNSNIYRVHKNYKDKSAEGKWVEFGISKQLDILALDKYVSNRIECRDYRLDDISYLIQSSTNKLKAFGGIQYIEPKNDELSVFSGTPLIGYQYGVGFLEKTHPSMDRVLPVFPHRIRFWVEGENK